MSTNNNNLDTTITVNGTTYKVNAETANQVANSLVVDKSLYAYDTEDNKYNDYISSTFFNGSGREIINIVPSNGGKFMGPVHIVANKESKDEFPNEALLNYGDIKGVLLNNLFNNSAVYHCDNNGTI
jgi:hypothetical protein